MTDFIVLGSKGTANCDFSHRLKLLLLTRKVITNLYNVLKSKDITLLTKSIESKVWFYQ